MTGGPRHAHHEALEGMMAQLPPRRPQQPMRERVSMPENQHPQSSHNYGDLVVDLLNYDRGRFKSSMT
jgi:hypothetical protein